VTGADHLCEENARLEADNARIDDRNARLLIERAQLEMFARQLQADYEQADADVRDCQQQLADRDAAIDVLRTENAALRQRVDALAAQRWAEARTGGAA
jgi:predicted nuclease with TOPRIM domain